MTRPRLLDLFCGAGGAAMGYHRAGFEVVGVDLNPQPDYPFEFHQADALNLDREWVNGFDAVHASPPCQAHSRAWKINKHDHPMLIAPVREILDATNLPYVIENVEGARGELISPALLCGPMFGIHSHRHRLFEVRGFTLNVPEHSPHMVKTTKMGRAPVDGEYMHIVGNFSGVSRAREIMGMPWASRDGLREAIPPAYTEWIGKQLMEAV